VLTGVRSPQVLRYRLGMASRTDARLYRRGPLRTIWPSPSRPVSWRAAKRRADAEYGAPATPGWRDVDWPAHTHQAEIDGAAINYVDIGSGDQTVVFIHGLGGSWQNWLENIPAVAERRRVIALDLPGFGRSAMPRAPISITAFATAVDRLCAHLGLGPTAVVGNSMGGFTTAELAIRHPERVERAVLVDAAGITSLTLSQNRASERFTRSVVTATRGTPEGARRMLSRPGYTTMAFGLIARYPSRLARDLLCEQLGSVGSPGFMPAFAALSTYDITPRLGEIACPTLIVQGTEDILVPVGDAYEFARHIPHAATLILEDTGHVPMFERPLTFNRALLEFLDQDVAPDQPDGEQSPTLRESAVEGSV